MMITTWLAFPSTALSVLAGPSSSRHDGGLALLVAASTLLVALAVLLAAFGWGLRDLNRRLAVLEDAERDQ